MWSLTRSTSSYVRNLRCITLRSPFLSSIGLMTLLSLISQPSEAPSATRHRATLRRGSCGVRRSVAVRIEPVAG